ncbi:tRNA N6-adenosine threonylcarbamoyltransferase, mitochondrial isoform X2 [Halyomorpha halys]
MYDCSLSRRIHVIDNVTVASQTFLILSTITPELVRQYNHDSNNHTVKVITILPERVKWRVFIEYFHDADHLLFSRENRQHCWSFSKFTPRKTIFQLKKWMMFSTDTNVSNILGIETSCDDTGCGIVSTDGKLLGEALFSQQKLHSELGGIIPPIAKRLHKEHIEEVVNDALVSSSMDMSVIDGVAVTVKPGLQLSLAVGVEYAKKLCSQYEKPLIPIHHMEAHALTIRMLEKVDFPFLVLLVSGGHSLIAVVKSVDKFFLLGKSYDDAPGEALDKIARRLKVFNLEGMEGLSGGKAMEILSEKGNYNAFPLGEPLLHQRDCDFSFAGIKNSARQFIVEQEEKYSIEGDQVLPSVYDLCASTQFVITKHLCRRIQRAISFCQWSQIIPNDKQSLVVSGGVAANKAIKAALWKVCQESGYSLHVPPPHLCTDNGVMIAWNGAERWIANAGIVPHGQLASVDFQGK